MENLRPEKAIAYLQQVLGGETKNLNSSKSELVNLKTLPLWVSEAAQVYLVALPQTEILLVVPRAQIAFEGLITAYKHVFQKFKKPTLLLVDLLPTKTRGVLTRMRISYMSSQGALFAPDLGVVMARPLPLDVQRESISQRVKLYPFALKLIAAHLLNKPLIKNIESLTDLQKRFEEQGCHLGLSTLSRIFRQLSFVGIVNVSGLGPNKKFVFQDRALVWSKLLELELETVFKKYQEHTLPNKEFPWVYSGESALSFYSELSNETDQVIAMSNAQYRNWKKNANSKGLLSVKGSQSVTVEIWREDPVFLSQEKNLNIVELSLSFRRNPDPRIRLSLEEALSAVDLEARKLWE